jgi:molecular chaperone Hsp33
MKDYVTIALAFNNQVRIYCANTTNLVAKAHQIHKTYPTAAAALGRFLTVSEMMSLMEKNGEHLSLKIIGDGPIGSMSVEAQQGQVKGLINNPKVYLVYEDGPKKGKLNVAAAIGNGHLHVTKDFGLKEKFTSSIELSTSEIAEDFTYFFTISEQTPSAVALGVMVGQKNKILNAGGFIIQILPNCSDSVITEIESILNTLPPMTQLLNDGLTPEDITKLLSNDTAVILDKKAVSYRCDCGKVKFRHSLSHLSIDALQQFIDEDGQAEIVCDYCNKKYLFSKSDLEKIINKKRTLINTLTSEQS